MESRTGNGFETLINIILHSISDFSFGSSPLLEYLDKVSGDFSYTVSISSTLRSEGTLAHRYLIVIGYYAEDDPPLFLERRCAGDWPSSFLEIMWKLRPLVPFYCTRSEIMSIRCHLVIKLFVQYFHMVVYMISSAFQSRLAIPRTFDRSRGIELLDSDAGLGILWLGTPQGTTGTIIVVQKVSHGCPKNASQSSKKCLTYIYGRSPNRRKQGLMV